MYKHESICRQIMHKKLCLHTIVHGTYLWHSIDSIGFYFHKSQCITIKIGQTLTE